MNRTPIFLEKVVKWLLFASAIIPLVTFRESLVFPYTWSKVVVFRSIVEWAVIALLVRTMFFEGGAEFWGRLRGRISQAWRTTLVKALLVFLASAALSTVFAVNKFHAFWGNVERGDGLLSLLHYAIFLLLLIGFFDKKDWTTFLRISLVVGAVMIIYGWLQFFGVRDFPFALLPNSRSSSFLGNPAFFSVYLIFLITFSLVLFLREKRSYGWRIFSSLVAFSAFVTIFLTSVRGALAGLFLGVLSVLLFLAFKGSYPATSGWRSPRRLARVGLAVLGVVVILVFFTRDAAFWQDIPSINRVVSATLDDPSLQTRLSALRSGLRAFFERPIGWGLENFQVGYNKYSEPGFLVYEDAWFDRAHNKLLEVGVTQGLLGVLSYLGVFISFFLLLRRRSPDSEFGVLKPILAGGTVAYFVQNLFLFDDPVSYLMLTALFGFVLTAQSFPPISSSVQEFKAATSREPRRKYWEAGRMVAGWALLIATAVLFYASIVIPFRQSTQFVQNLSSKSGEKILSVYPQFTKPYNYLQPTIRFRFLELLLEDNLVREPRFEPLVKASIEGLEEVARKEEQYEPRHFIKLAEVYNEKGKDSPEFFVKAEENARKALRLSPQRQNIYYPLAFSLAGQERYDEAIAVAREAVSISPELAKAHFNLGLHLALAGKTRWDEAIDEFHRAVKLQGETASRLGSQDRKNLEIILKEMLVAHIYSRDRARAVGVAELFLKLEDAPRSDLEFIISLADEGKWDELIAIVKKGRGE